jgi:small-conductance mechanosensitive channel
MAEPRRCLGASCLILLLLLITFCAYAQPAPEAEKPPTSAPPPVTVPANVGKNLQDETSKVKEQLAQGVRSLFQREPLGFNEETLQRVSAWFFGLPARIPSLLQDLYHHMRFLGIFGSLILLAFLGMIFYSLTGWKRVLAYLTSRAQPLRARLPEAYYPLILSALRLLAATLIPLLLYGLYDLIQEFIDYRAAWFILTGRLLKLWTFGALIITGCREILLAGHFPIPLDNALRVYRVARVVILAILFSLALVAGARIFQIPPDVVALLRFVISLLILLAMFILLLRKQTVLGIMPQLPYKTYQVFYHGLERVYYPALGLTLATGLMWCAGYKNFAEFVWEKTWAVAGAFVGIMLVFHKLRLLLHNWIEKKPNDLLAVSVHKSLYYLLIFVTTVATSVITLRLLGLYDPLRRVVSSPLLYIGASPISLWTFIIATLVLIGFIFFSRLMRAYLDYKIYPFLGIEEGLAYSINSLLGYLIVAIGAFIALTVIGIDFRTLMVFAGAIGIGIGLGLQKVASNLVSGLIIIFGRKIRKGDWIKVGDTLGYVRHINLNAATLWTRDNIEYIIPNTDLIAGTIINYTLTSPEIRVHLPVGVSYTADPAKVTEILLATAKGNKNLVQNRAPQVWFTNYGDSAINFELLVWIDVRRWSEGALRSQLYYDIFAAFAQAGIEIPFPQRDIHIRSGPWPGPPQEK